MTFIFIWNLFFVCFAETYEKYYTQWNIFLICKESARKKAKINGALLWISIKKVNSKATFWMKLLFKDVHVFPFDLQLLLLLKCFLCERSRIRKHSEVTVCRCVAKKLPLKISENSQENICPVVSLLIKTQESCNFLKKETQHRCFRVTFLQNTSGWLLPNINSELWRFQNTLWKVTPS